jgi:hypothetical protein
MFFAARAWESPSCEKSRLSPFYFFMVEKIVLHLRAILKIVKNVSQNEVLLGR